MSDPNSFSSDKKSKAPLIISAAIIMSVILSYFFIPGVNHFFDEAWRILTSNDKQKVKEWVEQFGWWGPAIIVLSMILQMFLLVIPTPLLMIVTTLAYGPLWGSVITLFAIFAASTVGYGIGANLGAPLVTRLLGQRTEKKIESFIEDYGFWTIIVTRLSPFLSNDAVSFVGGILRMGYWRFIGATLIGILPLTLLIAYLGEDISRLKKGLIWGSVACLLLFGAYIWWDRRRKTDK